jgi:hypothetical protein
LVVLCAGSVLLLVEDALTSIVNGALVGVSLSYQASPSGVWLFPTGLTYLGFLLREKLAVVLTIPSSWGSQLDGDLHHHRAAKQPPPREKSLGEFLYRVFRSTPSI